jgi:hypothetical protein
MTLITHNLSDEQQVAIDDLLAACFTLDEDELIEARVPILHALEMAQTMLHLTPRA